MMKFRTEIEFSETRIEIRPESRILCIGSCFAARVGERFTNDYFSAEVNPYGTMYNPVSILHTVEKLPARQYDLAIFTLGTNHVYIERASGQIVDNCQKRPQSEFEEHELSIQECVDAIQQSINLLRVENPKIQVLLTVSPIRYQKYGFHGSQLSKATLLLAADEVIKRNASNEGVVEYFPAYEIINDELRDYRFYAEDMLHPSSQAVEYIWQHLSGLYFPPSTRKYIQEAETIRRGLNHRPFDANSPEYQKFRHQLEQKIQQFRKDYPNSHL